MENKTTTVIIPIPQYYVTIPRPPLAIVLSYTSVTIKVDFDRYQPKSLKDMAIQAVPSSQKNKDEEEKEEEKEEENKIFEIEEID